MQGVEAMIWRLLKLDGRKAEAKAERYGVKPPSISTSLRNDVAKALIADVTLADLPQSRRAWAQRQTMLTQAIARATGRDFATVRFAMLQAWPKIYGRRVNDERRTDSTPLAAHQSMPFSELCRCAE